MKLWQKISLVCAAALLLTVGICSGVLLAQARDVILGVTVENARAKQKNLATSFRQMVQYYGTDGLSPVAERSMLKYCFERFADDTSALFVDGELVYAGASAAQVPLQEILPLKDDARQGEAFRETGGAHWLVVGGREVLSTGSCAVYTAENITSVYETISLMAWRFALVSALCVAGGTALTVFLARRATRPLKKLGEASRRIARGEYGERAAVFTRDEAGELAGDFNSMADAVEKNIAELKETAERRRLFIGGLTHEFKTPMASVIGHAETLLYTRQPPEITERSLAHIYEQCKWLERLTQKLMALITLGEGAVCTEQPVEGLLEAVRAGVREAFEKRGTLLEVENTAETLPMDFDLMLSALINLADNASKASEPGQTVTIRAFGRTIEVADKGRGIAEEELPRITEPFYMADRSRSKKNGGSGLGLALVEKIAEAHGARLIVRSTPGEGTTFRIVFPDLR